MYESVITSDWHLDGMNKILGASARDKQMKVVEQPFKYAVLNQINNIDILGDMFDSPTVTESWLISVLGLMLKYPDIKKNYIIGNHDMKHLDKTASDVIKSLSDRGVLPNLNIYTNVEYVKEGGVNLTYVPFPHKEYKKRKPSIVFCHTETVGAIGDNGRPLKSASYQVARHPEDFIISGHLHQYQTVPKHRSIYCGSPYQKNFGEAAGKGFVHLKASYKNDRLAIKHDFIEHNAGFELINLTIESSDDLKKLDRENYFKLHIAEGVVLKPSFMNEYPNVIHITGMGKRKDIEVGQALASVKDLPKFDVFKGLDTFLNGKLKEKEIKYAVKEVQKACLELGLL